MTREFVDDIVLVSEAEIAAAIRHAYWHERQVVEGSGSVAYDYLNTPTGERIVVETTGDDPIASGATVSVDFENKDALFFDASNEARLR